MAIIDLAPPGIAPAGEYVAMIHSTKYVGDFKTQYGIKHNGLEIIFRVQDLQDAGKQYEIRETYPMTLDSRSNFYDLLVGLRINPASAVGKFDTDSLNGKILKILVFHKKPNAKYANAKPLPPNPSREIRI
jgi:hypothetical protein